MHFPSAIAAQRSLQARWRWPNFSVSELSCGCDGRFCGGAYWHDPGFLDPLQMLREEIGGPLVLTSAHRCPLWNAAIGGAPFSAHKRIAADISLHALDRFELLTAARDFGFTGLGLARTFLHLDRRSKPATWFYKGSEALWQR